MHVDEVRELLLAMPGCSEETPFGPDTLVYKVGGKMFASIAIDEVPPFMNLKCDPDRALRLRDRYAGVLPGYHMNKKHWNSIVLDGELSAAIVAELVDHSWELVLAGLPKALREEIGGRR